VAHDAAAVPPAELEAFAVRSLPNIEIVFDAFYRRYDPIAPIWRPGRPSMAMRSRAPDRGCERGGKD
jgi:hypothetical protein